MSNIATSFTGLVSSLLLNLGFAGLAETIDPMQRDSRSIKKVLINRSAAFCDTACNFQSAAFCDTACNFQSAAFCDTACNFRSAAFCDTACNFRSTAFCDTACNFAAQVA